MDKIVQDIDLLKSKAAIYTCSVDDLNKEVLVKIRIICLF